MIRLPSITTRTLTAQVSTSRYGQVPIRVRVNVPREFPDELLIRLGEHAVSRGVRSVNLVDPDVDFQFVRITCQSMTVPVALLDYVQNNDLPWDSVLEQPEYLSDPTFDSRVRGGGRVIALKGVAVYPGVTFLTEPDRPIILRENSSIGPNVTLQPGTVVP